MGVYFKNGLWWIDYYDGTRRVRECIGTKKDAEQALIIRKAEIAQGRFQLTKAKYSPLLKEFVEEYLRYAKNNKTLSAYQSDFNSLKALLPQFGNKRLSQIDYLGIEIFKEHRLKTVGPATVNRNLQCLRRMLNLAVVWGKIPCNPIPKLKLLKEPPKRERTLCAEEIQKLLAVSKKNRNLHDGILLAFNTGMRLSEVLNLRWCSVNFESLVLTVEHGKGGKSRKIPMNSVVLEMIQERLRGPYKTEPVAPGLLPAPYIFPVSRSDKPYTRYGFRAMFDRAKKRAGIKCSFHDLRHSFAHNLVLGGVDLATVQELMGHASVETTMRYVHPTSQVKREAVNIQARHLSPIVKEKYEGEIRQDKDLERERITVCEASALASEPSAHQDPKLLLQAYNSVISQYLSRSNKPSPISSPQRVPSQGDTKTP